MVKNFVFDCLKITEKQVEFINKLANNFDVKNINKLYNNIIENICDTNFDGVFVSVGDSIIHELYSHIINTLSKEYNVDIVDFEYIIDEKLNHIIILYNGNLISNIDKFKRLIEHRTEKV